MDPVATNIKGWICQAQKNKRVADNECPEYAIEKKETELGYSSSYHSFFVRQYFLLWLNSL